MPIFYRDGLSFNYVDTGEGIPFVFQHGLGGDLNQPLELYLPQPGFRLIAFDCRGHGDTRPLGSIEKLRFKCFAADLLALIDALGAGKIVIGGISMGAGVALNFAVNHPERVRGLILSRPAWLDSPLPNNLRVMVRIAGLIREHGAKNGLEVFRRSAEYAALLREAPDVAKSLSAQFEHPRAEETVAKLECLPNDVPITGLAQLAAINVPTMILATRVDPVHPFEYATVLAQALPGAISRELTPKSISRERHTLETQQTIGEFLQQLRDTVS
jgi:pimeloyl-ACP methyl ester carboxylesterase